MPREMTYTSHIWIAPMTTSTASAATKTAFHVREMRRIRRGELRSTTAPPTNMNSARGRACNNRVKPTAAGSWVSFSTSQGSATRVKVSPTAEMLLPEKSSRKSLLENTEVLGAGAGVDMAVTLYIGMRMMPQGRRPGVVANVMPGRGPAAASYIGALSPVHDQQREAAGRHRALGPRRRARGTSRRRGHLHVRRHQVHVVVVRVQGHGAGELLRRGVLQHRELVRRILMHHGEVAVVAVGTEGELGGGIEAAGIHPFPDG